MGANSSSSPSSPSFSPTKKLTSHRSELFDILIDLFNYEFTVLVCLVGVFGTKGLSIDQLNRMSTKDVCSLDTFAGSICMLLIQHQEANGTYTVPIKQELKKELVNVQQLIQQLVDKEVVCDLRRRSKRWVATFHKRTFSVFQQHTRLVDALVLGVYRKPTYLQLPVTAFKRNQPHDSLLPNPPHQVSMKTCVQLEASLIQVALLIRNTLDKHKSVHASSSSSHQLPCSQQTSIARNGTSTYRSAGSFKRFRRSPSSSSMTNYVYKRKDDDDDDISLYMDEDSPSSSSSSSSPSSSSSSSSSQEEDDEEEDDETENDKRNSSSSSSPSFRQSDWLRLLNTPGPTTLPTSPTSFDLQTLVHTALELVHQLDYGWTGKTMSYPANSQQQQQQQQQQPLPIPIKQPNPNSFANYSLSIQCPSLLSVNDDMHRAWQL